MNKKFLDIVMNENSFTTLTICGSARYRSLKEKYQAYYTLKNNLVFAPVNYLLIKNQVETTEETKDNNAKMLVNIHDKKILLSEAIIVVNGEECYFGSHTTREILFAYQNNKKLLFSNIPDKEKEKYYFNNDKTYPLYILKEEYK